MENFFFPFPSIKRERRLSCPNTVRRKFQIVTSATPRLRGTFVTFLERRAFPFVATDPLDIFRRGLSIGGAETDKDDVSVSFIAFRKHNRTDSATCGAFFSRPEEKEGTSCP